MKLKPSTRALLLTAVGVGAVAMAAVVLARRSRRRRRESSAGTPTPPPEDERASGETPAQPEEAPAIRLHPAIVVPERVYGGDEYEIVVGVALDPIPGVAGAPLDLEVAPDEDTSLTYEVELDGFKLATGRPAGELVVRPGRRYVGRTLRVMAVNFIESARAATIHIAFEHAGRPVGEGYAVTLVERP